ncbi:hypothetical protein CBS101457_004248 [Exobasidium rhododendri]|nr:hypothetical protein CBS101457_004248 [Exobasidium rhododendri]
MADYASRQVNTSFKGLTTTVAIFAAVGSICLIGFETMRQLRRLPKASFVPIRKQKEIKERAGRGGQGVSADDREGKGKGIRELLSCEDWEMGHLYLARMFHASTPTPAMASWPLAWALQALKFDEWFYAVHTGMDTVVYVRFLKACVCWVLLQTLTTAPILLAVHFKFSRGAPLSDMSSASLSYLVTICAPDTPTPINFTTCTHVPNEEGRKLLWIHLCLLWYITMTWFYALWWIAKGSIRTRRRWIGVLAKKRQKAEEDAKAENLNTADGAEGESNRILDEMQGIGGISRGDDSDGWRQRTLLVTNLPPTMRDEASVRRYFEEFLRPDDCTPASSTDDLCSRTGPEEGQSYNKSNAGSSHDEEVMHEGQRSISVPSNSNDTNVNGKSWGVTAGKETKFVAPTGPEPDVRPNRHLKSPIQSVVLVRKMNELSAMLNRRQEVLAQLEAAHIKLAQSVLRKIGRQSQKMMSKGVGKVRDDGAKGVKQGSRVLAVLNSKRGDQRGATEADVEKHAAVQLREDALRLNDLTHRLARFAPGNSYLPLQDAQGLGVKEEAKEESAMKETVWEALAEVPRDLLDPFQPVTRLSSLFRGQKVPTIDYLLTKLNLLTALVTEMRARPPTSYEATSTAFVTFRDPRQARMVWRELKSQIVVKVRLAPEVKDLDWERLMRTSFTGDIVRGFSVNAFFWAFTVLWVIPVGLLCTSLFSVDKLEGLFPTVEKFFKDNPNFQGFVSNTLPSLIVSILTMCVPELIFQISKRAQGFVTFSALYDQCLCRYWKFVICNVVIFFCVGATTVQSIIFQIGKDNTVLNSIAFAFPTAAPFYISYLILGMGLHTGFELLGFMVPLIQHLGARNAPTPRIRALKTLPRNFNRYYWLPFHVLILSIVFLFALLNPLIIPFGLVYLVVAFVVFKKNFAFTYFRRFNEKEGVVYYIRLFRFSLDGLLVAQIVILIFFSVTKQVAVYIGMTAVLIPINVSVKLLGTRLWKSQCRALEDEEANALCGITIAEPLTPAAGKRDYFGKNSKYGNANDDEATDFTSPLDARATGRYPAVVSAPQTDSKILLLWNHIHDRFNANGNDQPSYVVSAQARGSHLSAKIVTNAVASVPKAIVQSAHHKSRHFGVAARSLPNGATSKEKLPLPLTSAKMYKKTLEQGQEGAGLKKSERPSQQKKLMRGQSIRSLRSEEAPFLSGFDAINSHAPVASESGDQDEFGDGEFEEMLSMKRRATLTSMKSQRRQRRSVNYSTAIVKGRPTDVVDESALSVPQEGDESGMVEPVSKAYKQREAEGDDEVDDDEEEEEEEESNKAEGDKMQGRSLIRPHAKVRWDDTPNNSAKYNNPFYSVELDPFLWLPRDPMKAVDLCDTVEWHGAALVSSQGGAGRVGEWDDDQEEDGEDDKENSQTDTLEKGDYALHGGEQIEIVGALAQHLQEAEETDDAVDPAASISRNQMEDYKKAIEEENHRYDYDAISVSKQRSPSMTDLEGQTSSRLGNSNGGLDEGSKVHMWTYSSNQAKTMSTLPSAETFNGEKKKTPAVMEDTTDTAVDEGRGDTDSVTGSPRKGQVVESPSGISFASPMTATISSTMLSHAGKARQSSHATSHKTAESVLEHGEPGNTATRTVSMRKALKAEVLEEEFRRTVKFRLTEKKRREKEGAASEGAAAKSSEAGKAKQGAEFEEMELYDLEAQKEKRGHGQAGSRHGGGSRGGEDGGVEDDDGDDTIMAHYEKQVQQHNHLGSPKSRRDANMSGKSTGSVRHAMSSAFSPRKSGGKTSSSDVQTARSHVSEMGVKAKSEMKEAP